MFYSMAPVVMRRPSSYINAMVLAAGVEEKQAIPSGYNLVVISASANVYVKVGTSGVTASVPSGDVSNGTASEIAPTAYYLNGDETHISAIAETDATMTLSYYRQV